MRPPLPSYPKVFIIVLNYNSGKTLQECLSSVYHLDYPNFEVVLADNASTDGSFETAKENFSRSHFIQSGKNIGFAAGNNLGIRFALEKMADFIFLLNPDAVVEKETLSVLISEAKKNPRAGILSPLIFRGQGEEVWFAGGKIEWNKMRAIHLKNISSEETYATEYLSGCAMLIRKEVFKKVELLDEDYFLYYEDTDFSWRTAKQGFSLLVVPGAKVFHFEESTKDPEAKTYWLVLSGLIFFQKNAPLMLKPWLKVYVLMRKIKNWNDLRKGKNPLAETVKRAYNDYALWKKNSPKYRS